MHEIVLPAVESHVKHSIELNSPPDHTQLFWLLMGGLR